MWISFAIAASTAPSMQPDEIWTVHCPDGWRAPLRRYRGTGTPILLVHGMGANHYNWDFHPDISLAHALQSAGRDVWVVVLPGDVGSEAPSVLDARDLDFDRWVDVHVPAVIDRVLEVSGERTVQWVGHSMGGMLLFASLDDPRIAAGVSISGAAQFDSPTDVVRVGRGLRSEGGGAELGARWAWTAPFNPVVGLVARRRHMKPAHLKGLARHALEDTPSGVVSQLHRWTREGPITREDGRDLVDFSSATPLLLVGGSRDRLVSPRDIQQTCDRFVRCERIELRGYGHVDTVLGEPARSEVYPVVVTWLDLQEETDELARSGSSGP